MDPQVQGLGDLRVLELRGLDVVGFPPVAHLPSLQVRHCCVYCHVLFAKTVCAAGQRNWPENRLARINTGTATRCVFANTVDARGSRQHLVDCRKAPCLRATFWNCCTRAYAPEDCSLMWCGRS